LDSNTFYADSSLLWEVWLGDLTDPAAEIVVNRHRAAVGGKTVQDYGELMRQAFAHAARVLKPGGRAVLAFSNSDDQAWQSVQKALVDAGSGISPLTILTSQLARLFASWPLSPL
jgi:adenine-specific DNA methylase